MLRITSLFLLVVTLSFSSVLSADEPIDFEAVFLEFEASGFAAGSRGEDNPNRFLTKLEDYQSLNVTSQKFILTMFNLAKLYETQNDKTVLENNGVLASLLISLTLDIEATNQFIVRPEIALERGWKRLPPLERSVDRLLEKFPLTEKALGMGFIQAIRELSNEAEGVLQAEADRVRAEADSVRAEADSVRAEREGLEKLNAFLQGVMRAVSQ